LPAFSEKGLGDKMSHIAAAVLVGLILAIGAHVKGRTGWHWFLLSVCAFGAVWLLTVAAMYVAGIQIWLGSPKLALFVGMLTALPILVTLFSVPARPRRHLAVASSRTPNVRAP
jgi:hypothetical protein